MNSLDTILGEICEKVFPISDNTYFGNSSSTIAICTLSSMKLLEEIVHSDLMNHVAIAGRLLSENKGIDSMIINCNLNHIKTIILCGKEVWGHKTGHSLTSLHKNGIDFSGRIINSSSPNPVLTVAKKEIIKFQNQTKIINYIGETEYKKISKIVLDLN